MPQCGLLMLGARLGDRFGRRRTITVSLAVCALGALLGAVADSLVLLTAARCLQGAAADGERGTALAPGPGPGQPARVFTGATGAARTRPWKRAET